MNLKLGMGNIAFWGLTPAFNLCECEFVSESKIQDESINILLVSEGDARHSLKTIMESNIKSELKINIYLMESRLELCARELIFFLLAFDTEGGLIERRNQFMEIFANLLIRRQTKNCLDRLANLAIRMLTEGELLKEKLPFLSLSKMKFKERDALVEIFENWIKNDILSSQVELIWERRLRNHLKMRFDSKDGVFDWDYNMSLLDKGKESLGIISFAEYKKWRKTGLAFTHYESEYSQPNPTLLTGRRETGGWEYLGDIVTGPFISHGVEGDEELFEKRNKDFIKKTFDVTASNIEKMFNSKSSDFPHATINFLSGGDITSCLKNMSEKEEFKGFFHCVFLGSHSAQEVKESIPILLNDDGTLLVERIKYAVNVRKEHESMYENKVVELGKNVGLQFISPSSDLFIRFKKN